MAKIKRPSILSAIRKVSPSDAIFSEGKWDERGCNNFTSMHLREKTVLGTMPEDVNTTKGSNIESANIQTIDICSLNHSNDTVLIKYTIKVTGEIDDFCACNEHLYRGNIKKIISEYKNEVGFGEICHRYAYNIANARPTWRNRIGASSVETCVSVIGTDITFTFDSLELGLNNMDDISGNVDIVRLGDMIKDVFTDDKSYLYLEVRHYVMSCAGQEVFPSQEFINGEIKRNKKSRVLHSVDKELRAGMHSQKIGNAIRTIDTWYDEYEEFGCPIPAEIYGVSKKQHKAFRTSGSKTDFGSKFDCWINGEKLSVEDKHFVMSIIVRGGVLGEGKKKKGDE